MKNIITACLASLAFTLACMYVNYRSYLDTGHLKWAIRIHGGEITVEYGFGLCVRHIYAMMQGISDSTVIGFSPVSFLLTVLIFAVLAFLILKVWGSFRSKSTERR